MTISKKRIYRQISNIYARLPAFAADPPDNEATSQHTLTMPPPQENVYTSNFKTKAMRRVAARRANAKAKQEEELILDKAITWAEDGHTALAKLNTALPQRVSIDMEHAKPKAAKPSILQSSKNWGYAFQSTVKGWARKVSQDNAHVTFATQALIQEFNEDDAPVMATLHSGADNHYISEKDRKKLNLPILKKSSRRVGVANGGTSKGVNVTQLPFKQLSAKAVKATPSMTSQIH